MILFLTWRALMIVLGLMILGGGAGKALAHRRSGLTAARPGPPPLIQPAPKTEEAGDSLPLTSGSYWSRLLAQEQAKEFPEARKTGLALVNLFPQAPQRGAALLKLAALAKAQGKTAEALELYGLVAFLTPGAPEAAQARLAASALEFVRDLKQSNPMQTLGPFLAKISAMPSGSQADILQEALVTGWQSVAHQVRATSPLPLIVLEELLVLWDRQPHDLRSPEGALLLADILKKNGLQEEAQTLQAQTQEKTRHGQEFPAKLTSFTATFNLLPSWEEQGFSLHSWLPPWRRQFSASASAGEAFLNWFLPYRAHADWLAGPAPALDQALLYSPPPSLPMASRSHSKTDNPDDRDHTPFQQDRLGLNRLQEGQPEAAEATFQELAQHRDPFWQRLGQVRLADLELSRLQTESAP